MKKKVNLELLKEELKRFKILNEYSFYTEDDIANPHDDLLLGNLSEVDEDPVDAASNIASDLGVPPPAGEATVDGGMPPADGAQAPNPGNAEDVPPPSPEPAPMPEPAPEEDGVEIDVTSLVDSTDEAKQAADTASQNTEALMQKLNDLESRIASMDSVSNKIEALEKEIIKRNPTDVEKLEMRSLSSFPYSQKLTDYWADKEGQYDVMNNEPEEYTLTKDDVDADYSDANIKKSFSVKPEEYEEEDI